MLHSFDALTIGESLEKCTKTFDMPKCVSQAVASYKGDMRVLESAIGFLITGMVFGYRVLLITHAPRTIKNYQKILSIKIRDVLPAETFSSLTVTGYRVQQARNLSFWKVVSGEIKVPQKNLIEPYPF